MTIPLEQAVLNLGVTLGLSAVVGFERQWRNRLAGLRTNTLVALGAASSSFSSSLFLGNQARLGWPRRSSPVSDFLAQV
jgi:putative Mg2+ transporter-C (MgtC) family protein